MPTYTKFKHHDPALQNGNNNIEYRKYLIDREIKKKNQIINELKIEEENISDFIHNAELAPQIVQAIDRELQLIIDRYYVV